MNENELAFETQMFVDEPEEAPQPNSPKTNEENADTNKTSKNNNNDAELLWSIEDDGMFFPLGLSNHGTGNGKTVFVTWSENYLLNFVFKKSKKSQKVQLTKVRLAIPQNATTGVQEEIREILILELNSLILMRSGCVYYFSSVKSMHPIAWLGGGVRAIARAAEGFSVVRWLEESQQLALEVYRDISNLGRSQTTLVDAYDISYNEENIFNCAYEDEGFALQSQQVTADNRVGLERLIGNCKQLTEGQQVHFLAVSCNVFVVIAAASRDQEELENTGEKMETDGDETSSGQYHIELLNTYASPVVGLHLYEYLNFLLVFLDCGTIDIWYISDVAKSVQRKCYTAGTRFTHYDIEVSQQCLIFLADDEKVTQLQCQYDPQTDSLEIKQAVKDVPGIVACTWVDSIQQLVCLNANNIFHQLSFDAGEKAEEIETQLGYENPEALYELTAAKVAKLQEKAENLKELVEMPQQLQRQIERECIQQQLISVAHKTLLYQRLLDAELVYAQNLPEPSADCDEETVYVHATDSIRVRGNSLYALLYLHCRDNQIFHTAQWHCKIDYGPHTLMLHLPAHLINTKLCICVPLELQEPNRPLPQFKARLLSFVACGGFYQCISLHYVLKENAATLRRLFSTKARRLNLTLNRSIEDLLEGHERKPATQPFVLEHYLNLPPDSDFKTLLNIFGVAQDTVKFPLQLNVYFLSSIVAISYEATAKRLKLVSSTAVALFYTQLYIIYRLDEQGYKYRIEPDTGPPLLTQYQCQIERCYGSQLDTPHTYSANHLHMENLRRVYAKLRLSEYLTIVKR